MGVANLILLATGLLLQGFLLAVLLRRRIYWHFPCFVLYTAYSVIATIALLATSPHYRLYLIAYWANEAGLALFSLLALHEVFRKVFFGFYAQFRWFRMLFPAAAILAILIVFWSTGYTQHQPFNQVTRLILIFGLSVNFMQIGLFCLFIAIAREFRLRWQFAPLGILLGLTLAAFGSIFFYWIFSEFGTRFENFTKYFPPVSYILAIVVWLDIFFFRPEPGPGRLSAATLRQLAEEMRHDTMIVKKFMERFK